MKRTIDLSGNRGSNSTTFTGRPEGEKARKDLEMDKINNNTDSISIIIPKGTSSINPSFFLGLFYKTIKEIGVPKFRTTYSFVFLDDDEVIKEILRGNIEEGIVYAENFINKKGGLLRFIK